MMIGRRTCSFPGCALRIGISIRLRRASVLRRALVLGRASVLRRASVLTGGTGLLVGGTPLFCLRRARLRLTREAEWNS
jgi:hypothetical protein